MLKGGKKALAGIVIGFAVNSNALAADFKIIPRTKGALSATDNVNLSNTNRVSDLVLLLEPGITLSADGNRLKASIDYAPQFLEFIRINDSEQRQNLTAIVDAELIDDFLFVSGRASLRQVFLDRQGSLSGSEFNRSENRRTVQTYTGEANIRRRLKGDIDVNATYRFGINLSSADDVDNPAEGTRFSDTRSHEYSASIGSDPNTSRLNWRIIGRGSRVNRSQAGRTFKNDRAEAELEYRFSSTYAIFGRAGWTGSNLTNGALGSDGFSWSAGLRFTPSERTSVEIRAGKDGERSIVAGSLDYKVTRRANLSLDYSDELSTNVLVDNQALANAEPLVGSQSPEQDPFGFNQNIPGFSLSDQDFRRRNLSANLTWRKRRTSAILSGNWERRTFASSQGNDRIFGGSLRLEHQLDRSSDLVWQIRFTNNKFGSSLRKDDTILNRIMYRKSFNNNLDGVISYSYSERFSSDTVAKLREHGLTLSLQVIF